MSLDFYLKGEPRKVKCRCTECNHEHEREESETIFSRNITHNLGKMADAAGIYMCLWRPEEIPVKRASEIIGMLRVGLKKLKDNPEHYKKFDSENGWGTYVHFVPFVEEILHACEDNPDALIDTWR